MIENDTIKRILYVDLSRRRFWVEEDEDLFKSYLGGAGVAIQLLHKECPKGIDPFSPDNPAIFTVGQFNAIFPIASKMVAMFKSPLTGNLGESHGGGRSAIAMRMAGYGALVIKGKSETPVYIAIHDDDVHFRDASVLWGMSSSYTVGRIIREQEPGSGIRTIMRIGRAGEQLVSYACLITETYRHFGRMGLGAVLGSKKVKAIVISGKRSFKFKDQKLYRQTYKEIFKSLVESPLMKKYHELGTSMNINPLNERKVLPTKNLKDNHFDLADEISGEAFAVNYLGRRVACSHCPVSCIHIAALREPYESEPYFYKTNMISYDYELIYSLGSMLGVGSSRGLLKLMDEVEIQGLDAISTGVALAWATEMKERGYLSEKETFGLNLKWGDYENYIKAIKLIVEQPNDFFRFLAKGVIQASSKYGGTEFALAFGGNEMPGYHTGPIAYVGFITGARHSHLDSAGYSFDQKFKAAGKNLVPQEIANSLIAEEKWRQILSSLVICFFARKVYTPEIVSKAYLVLEYDLVYDDLLKIGEKILKSKYDFKTREGFRFDELKIPHRIFELETLFGKISKDVVKRSIKKFKDEIENL
ncbi:MAG: aldehyde ferredoxin oxidoreductase family protein [Candidatus Methylarchaceae archaeon HK02M2]|nr:aldehyde ferredoxin oxidoreductase family protein [Candidatus Methylarchaceae archaeon HK02M2]